ncbi:MAG: glycosyltransferase [Actinomycetota bacterium]|nr:glycosyltransferase [Actinomycetota bacterium]
MRFSVVIPTMSRPEPLRRTLVSLRAADPCPDEVFVIDAARDASARDTVLDFQDGAVPVRYLHTEPSLTRQRNIGIDEASGDVVVFLDDDVKLPRDLFAKLARTFADPTVVGATGWVKEPRPERAGGPESFLRRLFVGGSRKHAGRFTRYGYPRYVVASDGLRDVEFMPGCFMSARREVAAQLRFDEHLGAYALAEDEDFSYRLSRHGRVVYLPDVVVEHEKLGFRSFDSRDFGRLVVKNRAYLFRKNFPQTPLARLQFGLLLLKLVGHRALNREWSGALGLLEGMARLVRGRA